MFIHFWSRIKTNIEPANAQALQKIFRGLELQSYDRTDGVVGKRTGFIAQQLERLLPEDGSMDMLVPTLYHSSSPLLGVDYSRLSATVLWQQVKSLTERVEALEAKAKPSKKKT